MFDHDDGLEIVASCRVGGGVSIRRWIPDGTKSTPVEMTNKYNHDRWQNHNRGGMDMKLSARNVLKGKVKNVNVGPVNAEVIIELGSGVQVVAIITKTSADSLALAAGKDVYAVFKASAVIVAID